MLRKLDVVKRNVEGCRDTLQEAAQWSKLSDEAESHQVWVYSIVYRMCVQRRVQRVVYNTEHVSYIVGLACWLVYVWCKPHTLNTLTPLSLTSVLTLLYRSPPFPTFLYPSSLVSTLPRPPPLPIVSLFHPFRSVSTPPHPSLPLPIRLHPSPPVPQGIW